MDFFFFFSETYRWKKIKPNFEYYEKVEIFTDNNNVDVVLTPSDIPMQRYGHSIVAYKNKAYLWGGRNDQFGDLNVLYEFDPGYFLIVPYFLCTFLIQVIFHSSIFSMHIV